MAYLDFLMVGQSLAKFNEWRQPNGFNECASNALQYRQLYKHPLIMMYASVHLSAIITSILSPSDTSLLPPSLLPHSPPPPLPLPCPERVPAPPAAQPFNLVSPICMTGTKTYDLAWPHTDGETGGALAQSWLCFLSFHSH